MKIRGTSSATTCLTKGPGHPLSRLPVCLGVVVSAALLFSVHALGRAAGASPPALWPAVMFGPGPVEATPVKQEALQIPVTLIIREVLIESVNELNRRPVDAPSTAAAWRFTGDSASAVGLDLLEPGSAQSVPDTASSLVPPVSVIGVLLHKDDRFADGFNPNHRSDWLYVRAGRRLLALSMQQDVNRKPHLQVQIPVGSWLSPGRQAAPDILQRSGVSCGHLRPLVRPLVGEQLGHSLSCRLILPW